jgi:ElaB/YqjD/DUF883 family membrane-anchored ribosome-binding protein
MQATDYPYGQDSNKSAGDVAMREMTDLKADLGDLASQLTDLAQRGLRIAREKLQAGFESSQSGTKDYADYARQTMNQGLERGCDYVREHPWQSIALAAGAGLLLGSLIGRR